MIKMRMWVYLVVMLLFVESQANAQTLSGSVLNAATSGGLVGFDLDVFNANGSPVAVTGDTTDASGNFTITLPGPGQYLLRADATQASGFVDLYYRASSNGTFYPSEATVITVGAGQTINNLNIRLTTSTRLISGNVKLSGANTQNVDMDLFVLNPTTQAREFISGSPAKTDASGNYSFGVLPAGTYFVRADPNPALGQYYVSQFHSGQATLAGATPIVVGGSTITGINFNLTQSGGAISGSVRAQSNNAGLPSIDLDLYNLNGVRVDVNAVTAADGTYVMGVMPAGQYRLRVDPTVAQGYPRLYYIATGVEQDGLPITVTAGATTPNINFSLPLAGIIIGQVTGTGSGTSGLPGIDIDVFDMAGKRIELTALSNVNGNYSIGAIAPGNYILRADPAPTQGYMTEYFNNQPDLTLATMISVGAGGTLSNINFSLDPAGYIAGTVRNGAAQPQAGIDLDVFDAATGQRRAVGAMSAADGTYLVGPLPLGNYVLRCDPTVTQGLAVEYYNGKLVLAQADGLAVPQTGLTGIDFTLDSGGSFAGRVTWGQGVPYSYLDLDVLLVQGPGVYLRMDQGARTDAAGYYQLGPLPAGNYVIRADAPLAASDFIDTYYGNTIVLNAAVQVPLVAGQNQTGLDILLRRRNAADPLWAAYE